MLLKFLFHVSRNCENLALISVSCFAKFREFRGKCREITTTKIFAATLVILEKYQKTSAFPFKTHLWDFR